MKISDKLHVVVENNVKQVACTRCNHLYGPLIDNVKSYAKMKTFPITKAGPMLNPWTVQDDFELREFYCPSCATMISVELNKKSEPILWDIEIVA